MRFEEEEVRAVALGNSWVAAVTSLNFLRIFTEGGLQVCDMIYIIVVYIFTCVVFNSNFCLS